MPGEGPRGGLVGGEKRAAHMLFESGSVSVLQRPSICEWVFSREILFSSQKLYSTAKDLYSAIEMLYMLFESGAASDPERHGSETGSYLRLIDGCITQL